MVIVVMVYSGDGDSSDGDSGDGDSSDGDRVMVNWR